MTPETPVLYFIQLHRHKVKANSIPGNQELSWNLNFPVYYNTLCAVVANYTWWHQRPNAVVLSREHLFSLLAH